MNKQQHDKALAHGLKEASWVETNTGDGHWLTIAPTKEYIDRWFINYTADQVFLDRTYDKGLTWITLCPDCRFPFDSDEHENFG